MYWLMPYGREAIAAACSIFIAWRIMTLSPRFICFSKFGKSPFIAGVHANFDNRWSFMRRTFKFVSSFVAVTIRAIGIALRVKLPPACSQASGNCCRLTAVVTVRVISHITKIFRIAACYMFCGHMFTSYQYAFWKYEFCVASCSSCLLFFFQAA